MKFKYSAFTDTIDGDLDSYLEQLGYEFILSGFEDENDKYTLVANGFVSYHKEKPDKECASGHKSYDNFVCEELIDCTGNPCLFQAVTAIREDSDYMQWFVCEMGIWWLCDEDKSWKIDPNWWHKATLKELQNHFKI